MLRELKGYVLGFHLISRTPLKEVYEENWVKVWLGDCYLLRIKNGDNEIHYGTNNTKNKVKEEQKEKKRKLLFEC